MRFYLSQDCATIVPNQEKIPVFAPDWMRGLTREKSKENKMEPLTIGLFNDSFPPTIDGVANVTVNYAEIIDRDFGRAVVATPFYPDVTDNYAFEVVRYPSANIPNQMGYRAGYPFDPVVLSDLEEKKIDLIHTHCPLISTILARMLRRRTGAPIVFTYHTKFDIDIENLTASDALRKISIKFLLQNIEACDEVWVVSAGAGENLRSIGYAGEYIVMENGTDFERGRAPQDAVDALRAQHNIQPDETVFLFVGRMMWYKGVKLSLDGLAQAKARGAKFKFLLVGEGPDRAEIEAYIAQIGLGDDCVTTGAIQDRALLCAYFTLANLFLFPSTFDTNGIVVREAAACECPSLLIRGSCAAEGITDGDTGILIDESPDAMRDAVLAACADHARLTEIGRNAADKIYISWEDAVRKAYERYAVVIENARANSREDVAETSIAETFSSAIVQVTDSLAATREQIQGYFQELAADTHEKVEQFKAHEHNIFKSNKEK